MSSTSYSHCVVIFFSFRDYSSSHIKSKRNIFLIIFLLLIKMYICVFLYFTPASVSSSLELIHKLLYNLYRHSQTYFTSSLLLAPTTTISSLSIPTYLSFCLPICPHHLIKTYVSKCPDAV